jgi:uncharacterized membrane protein
VSAHRAIPAISFVVVLSIALLLSAPVVADLGAFTIALFDADIEIREDATVIVEERIEVDFLQPRRGIYRMIPVRYTDPKGFEYGLGFDLDGVTDGDGNPIPTKLSSEGSYRKIRIGDANRTQTGRVSYRIRYRLKNALRSFEAHDEIYWNVTGNEWNTTIAKARVTINLPADVADDDLQLASWTGMRGSTAGETTSRRDGRRAITVESMHPFRRFEGMTIAVGWPKGHVDFPGPIDRLIRFVSNNLIVVVPLFVFWGLRRRWRRLGRDPLGRGSVVVRYEPPEGMLPAEVGSIIDESVDFRDLTATIVDLAVRGVIRIRVEKKEALFGLISKEETVFERLQSTTDDLQEFERIVLAGIFYSGQQEVAATDLAQRFYTTVPKFNKRVYSRLVEQGYFNDDPARVRAKYLALAFVVAFAVGLLGILWAGVRGAVLANAVVLPIAAAVVSLLIGIYYSRKMPAKTTKGVVAKEWALGFQEFVSRVEREQLDAAQRRQAFESLLPYAMALGVAESWASQFEDIYQGGQAPHWYVGQNPIGHPFTASQLQSDLSRSLTQAATSMQSVPRSSGSSGFSSGGGGGGFSGGGGGGGGGGSW